MNTWGPILTTTDFSGPARHAVDRAARLAQETGSPLSVMHVMPGETLAELRHWLGVGHAPRRNCWRTTASNCSSWWTAWAAHGRSP
jgi:hypothetical protein